jgi:hypothetical protein
VFDFSFFFNFDVCPQKYISLSITLPFPLSHYLMNVDVTLTDFYYD